MITSSTLPPETVDLVALGLCATPFDYLGPHPTTSDDGLSLAVRTLQPGAVSVAVVRDGGGETPMRSIHPGGLYETVFAGVPKPFRYTLRVTDHAGATRTIDDAYRFAPVTSDEDLARFADGVHPRASTFLGAHVRRHGGVRGVSFAVWAPHARRVSVVGSFNDGDVRAHVMRLRPGGVWEIFVPGVEPGAIYKFHVVASDTTREGDKADPYGFATEMRPQTASVVCDLARARWRDDAWMRARAERQASGAPLAVYEAHLGSWRRGEGGRWLTYRELARTLLPYVKRLGFTHVQLLPVMEHPFDGSWGYQCTGYFAPTSRYGSPDDFRAFVDHAHRIGIGVLLDWVPAHFVTDGHGLSYFDGTHLYEHADPLQQVHPHWDTFVFDYSRPQVRSFLLSSALHWLREFHVDGLRVDAVASMIYLNYGRGPGEWQPNEHGGNENLAAVAFVRELTDAVHAAHPDALVIAEESTSWPQVTGPTADGGLGFDYKWNMGWMHDTLGYAKLEPHQRRFYQKTLTFSLMYAFDERFVLPLSHDEVVHLKKSLLSKMSGADEAQKRATLRAMYAYMYAHPGKKLLFMGAELGQYFEWNHDAQLEWGLLDRPPHRALQHFVRDLNALYARMPALHQLDHDRAGFEWIDCTDDARAVVSFLRRARKRSDAVLVVANFSAETRRSYTVGAPVSGRYVVLLNSDAKRYAGAGLGPSGTTVARPRPAQGQPCSMRITLPPLSVLVLKPMIPPPG